MKEKQIVYTVLKKGWSYNDEYYFHPDFEGNDTPSKGYGKPVKTFVSKEKAQEHVEKLSTKAFKELFMGGYPEFNEYVNDSAVEDISKLVNIKKFVSILKKISTILDVDEEEVDDSEDLSVDKEEIDIDFFETYVQCGIGGGIFSYPDIRFDKTIRKTATENDWKNLWKTTKLDFYEIVKCEIE